MCVYVCVYMYVCICICVYVYVYIYVYVYMYMCICVCTCLHGGMCVELVALVLHPNVEQCAGFISCWLLFAVYSTPLKKNCDRGNNISVTTVG